MRRCRIEVRAQGQPNPIARATHRATGIRRINPLPLSPRWATNVTA
jgi:hypothetical protein